MVNLHEHCKRTDYSEQGRRSSTFRRRVLDWKRAARDLSLVTNRAWPSGIHGVLDYLHSLRIECATSAWVFATRRSCDRTYASDTLLDQRQRPSSQSVGMDCKPAAQVGNVARSECSVQYAAESVIESMSDSSSFRNRCVRFLLIARLSV